jgi:hypothetical protein
MTFGATTRAAVLGATLLSGCSLNYWSKPGTTPEDARNDYTACAADARIAGPLVRPLRLAKCMNARGYEIDETACRGDIAGIPVQCARQ